MKALNFFFSLLITQLSFAQIWVEDNAVWHYDFWNIGAGVGFYSIERNGDSLIEFHSCERYDISTTRFWYYTQPPGSGLNDTLVYDGEYFLESQFIYTSNDSVYRWDGNAFQLLFDFNASVGDQWIISTQPNPWAPTCNDTAWVQVEATGIENIQGTNYRTITLSSPMDAPWSLAGTFNERFGEDYFFPRPGDYPCQEFIAEMDILSFKCFEDDSFNLYNPSGEDCEYYLTQLGTTHQAEMNIMVYPNPASSELNILMDGEFEVAIYSSSGVKIIELKGINNLTLDLADFKRGVYSITVSTSTLTAQRKFVKL